jgi:hypothetical protein
LRIAENFNNKRNVKKMFGIWKAYKLNQIYLRKMNDYCIAYQKKRLLGGVVQKWHGIVIDENRANA